MYSICYQQTNDVTAAEEMVQDIFVSLWKRWDEIEINSSLENYLIKSAKLKVIDYYRDIYKKNKLTIIREEESSNDKNHQQVNNDIEFEILQHHADQLITRLPKQCQTVYRLSRNDQKTTKEISLELGISQKTVKNHLTKALTFMREHLITNS